MGLAALALERSARIRQRPARWLWGTCMVASLAIPFIPSKVSVHRSQERRMPTGRRLPKYPHPRNDSNRTVADRVANHWRRSSPVINGVSTLMNSTWRIASMALALVILASGAHLSWSDVAGTAVISPGRPSTYRRITVPPLSGFYVHILSCPRRLTKLSRDEQGLVIAHERSHLGAYDPRLLTIAVCLLACMPWNLMLWWQVRRLPFAIEIEGRCQFPEPRLPCCTV